MSPRGMLRLFTYMEGASYLLLLLVAMPLKYGFGLPLAVRIAGGVHGVLFLAFAMSLYQTQLEYGWRKRLTFSLLAASLVPGSLFWLDRKIQQAS
jgi:integral membrane protein